MKKQTSKLKGMIAALVIGFMLLMPAAIAQEAESNADAEAKVTVKGTLSPEAEAKLDALTDSFANSTEKVELKLKAKQQGNETVIDANAKGSLTEEQQQLWAELQAEVKASMESNAEAGVEIEHGAEAKPVSATRLKLKRIGEKFGNAAFRLKAMLAFDKHAKLELIDERNEQMKERQRAWLEMKAEALAKFEEGNLTAEQKQEIIDEIQAEHQAIIEEHLRLTAQISRIKAEAMAEKKAALERKAELLEEKAAKSKLALGLDLEGKGKLLGTAKANGRLNLTAEEAAKLASRLFKIRADNVTTETRDNTTVYVVTGTETSTINGFEVVETFTAVIDASGLIRTADFQSHVEATAHAEESENEIETEAAEAEARAEARASAQASPRQNPKARASGNAAIGTPVADAEVGVGAGLN